MVTMAIHVPENAKQSQRRGQSCSPLCSSALCMPEIARGIPGPAAARSEESWKAGAAWGPHPPHVIGGAHLALKTLPSYCPLEGRLSPISLAQSRGFGWYQDCFSHDPSAGKGSSTASTAAWSPLPSGNSLSAPHTVSLGPAGFPINFYRKHKMTSGSLWQIGSHSSSKQGRALPFLNFSQILLLSSVEKKKLVIG